MYDLIIVGGSAAAASAGIYAIRRGLKTLIVAKDLGGEVALSGEVSNWLGVKETTGAELSLQFAEHLRSYDPELKEGFLVKAVAQRPDGMWTVTLDDDSTADGKALLIATGARSRELGVPGEKEYRLKGVSYCTVCDGPLFKGKPTAVIGGGNSALEAALMLADLCPTVTLINKNPAFKGEDTLIRKLAAKQNVTVVYEAMTTEILGDGKVATGLKYSDTTGAEHTVMVAGTFVHIGQTPNSMMVPDHCGKDPFGYLTIGLDGATKCPGLFAAGDVTHSAHKQIIIAAGQGAAAALSAVQYINRM